MFFDKVNEKLLLEGFREVSIEQSGLFIYRRENGEEKTCIILVNLPEPLLEDIHSIYYSLQYIKKKLDNANKTKFLFIYLVNEPASIRWMCQQSNDTHWILNRTEGKLVIYENQNEEFNYLREIFEEILMPKPQPEKKFTSYVTSALIGINILVYLIMYVILSSEERGGWVDYGGLFWPAIMNEHELWRFITSTFIHFGFEHLFNNMLLLFFVGGYLEDYIGHVKFAVLYFASGILAGVVSMGYNSINGKLVISCGASGAIFGIVGALVCFIFFARGIIKNMTASRLVVFTILSILSGIGTQGVDNMAHIGGLVSGFLLALIITLCFKGKNRKVTV